MDLISSKDISLTSTYKNIRIANDWIRTGNIGCLLTLPQAPPAKFNPINLGDELKLKFAFQFDRNYFDKYLNLGFYSHRCCSIHLKDYFI